MPKLSTYSFSKPNPGVQAGYIDISKITRDFYVYDPIIPGSASAEVIESSLRSVLLSRVNSVVIDTVGSTTPPTTNIYIATDGTAYYPEGANYQPFKSILLSHSEYRADIRGYFIVPLSVTGSSQNPKVNTIEVPLNFVDNTQNYVKYLIIPCNNYTGLINVEYGEHDWLDTFHT